MILFSVVCLAVSAASYAAVTPILGGTSTCVGGAATCSDATPGGTWTCSNITKATVGATTGVVTGVSAGTCTITYTLGTSRATVLFTVNPADVISGTNSVPVGSTITLGGSPLGGSWTSGTPTAASVSSTGVVTGLAPAVVNIYYTAGGCYTFKSVTVFATPSIGGSTSTCVGGTATCTSSIPGGAWSSSNTAKATVGATTGVVTGVSAGTCTITYTVGASRATVLFTVNPADVITGVSTVAIGSTITLGGSPLGGSWTSGTPTAATVTSTGVVRGLAPAVVNIYYTAGGCYTFKSVTVSATGHRDSHGVATPSTINNLFVHPNPGQGIFNVTGTIGSVDDELVTIEVTDMLGKLVYNGKVAKQNGELDAQVNLSPLANATYLLRLMVDGDSKVFHIVLAK